MAGKIANEGLWLIHTNGSKISHPDRQCHEKRWRMHDDMDMDYDGDVDAEDDFIADMVMLEYLENGGQHLSAGDDYIPSIVRGPSSPGKGASIAMIVLLCLLASLFT